MPGKGLPVSTEALYVVKLLIKIVLEAIRLKNIGKMTQIGTKSSDNMTQIGTKSSDKMTLNWY